jgi:DNA-binding transcriptional LysR family regulator
MEIELTRIFVKVVENSSFSKAALFLKLPKSTVSKAVSRLEKETGTKLLLRTTRSLTLTAAGRSFYETCMGPIRTLEDAQKSLYGADDILSGLIRLTAPDDFGNFVVSGAVAELLKKHPGLNFDLKFTNESLDLVKEGFDIAIRIGKLKESSLKAKKIGDTKLILVASSSYLKNKPAPRTPKELADHSCLAIAGIANKWELQSKKGTMSVHIQPRIDCNQVSSLMTMAHAGAGIALLPMFVCRAAIESGKLVRVLPDWTSSGWPVSMLSPVGSASSARLKITMDHLFAAVQAALQI